MNQNKSEEPVENPLADHDLVIYSTPAEDELREPTHESLEQLGLYRWSLWARPNDDSIEIPILAEGSNYLWFSLSQKEFDGNPADPVSDEFIIAIQQMTDEEIGGDWGAVEESIWEDLSDLERYIYSIIQQGFLKIESEMPALLIDWANKQKL